MLPLWLFVKNALLTRCLIPAPTGTDQIPMEIILKTLGWFATLRSVWKHIRNCVAIQEAVVFQRKNLLFSRILGSSPSLESVFSFNHHTTRQNFHACSKFTGQGDPKVLEG